MVATAQRFGELHPEIEIVWEKRSLQAFEDASPGRLAADYDLIVLDHPVLGEPASRRALLPLDEHLSAAFLADQATQSVGASHASYARAGHQWALAIDAATPIACWRADRLAALGLQVPRTWTDLLALARAGQVEIPAVPINSLTNFYALCGACGEVPFSSSQRIVAREVGRAALAQLRELMSLCDPGCWSRNPIASLELLSSDAQPHLCYCPFTYGYSNYARPGFAAHRLNFGEPPSVQRTPLRTTLGGAGLGVSALCPHPQAALAYAAFVASPPVQRTLYVHSGGQPGHRTAWLDAGANRLTHDYFRQTLPTLDRAHVRPGHRGYLKFQHHAALVVQSALRGTFSDREALTQLAVLDRAARPRSDSSSA